MSTEENKSIVHRFYEEVFNRKNTAALDEFIWHNTLASFLGVLAFLALLAFLQVALVLVDSVSAWLVLVYLVWVLGYDIPWAYRLWRLNPPETQPSRG